MTISQNECPESSFMIDVPEHLSHIKENYYQDTGYHSISGKLKNFSVTVSDKNLSIRNGSLSKYHLGNNYQNMTRQNVIDSIDGLSNTLNIPLENAIVKRVDSGYNLETTHKEQSYFHFMADCQYYTRLLQPNGLYYSSNPKTLVFYNKIKELSKHGEYTPENIKSKNLLRYEMRLSKGLNKALGKSIVTVGELTAESNYRALIDLWKDEYFRIVKQYIIIDKMNPTGSIKEFNQQAICILQDLLGASEFNSLIDRWKQEGHIDRRQKSDLKIHLKKASQLGLKEANNEIIKELDFKIREMAEMYY